MVVEFISGECCKNETSDAAEESSIKLELSDDEDSLHTVSDIDSSESSSNEDVTNPAPAVVEQTVETATQPGSGSSDKLLKDRTIEERLHGHYSCTYGFSKRPGHSIDKATHKLKVWIIRDPTGHMIRLNEVPNLCILDIDINHDKDKSKHMSENEKKKLQERIISICREKNYLLAETPSGGYHIYANCDEKWIEFAKSIGNHDDVCRVTGINVTKGLTLDIFTSMEVYENDEFKAAGTVKLNNVLMIPTEVKYPGDKVPRTSKFIVNNYDFVVSYSIEDVLDAFAWHEFVKSHKPKDKAASNKASSKRTTPAMKLASKNNMTFDEIDDEQDDIAIEALVEAINNFDIHNYTNTGDNADDPETGEVTLLVIFKAINCIKNDELREKAYLKCYDLCTEDAKKRFQSEKANHKDEKSSIGKLVNIIKAFNAHYYEEHVKNIICGFKRRPFKVNSSFTLNKFKEIAARKMYKSLAHAASDLARLYRYHEEGEDYFIERGIDDERKTPSFTYVKYETVKRKLKDIALYTKEIKKSDRKVEKTFTAWDAFIQYNRYFTFYGIKFNSGDPKYIDYFHGYKWEELESVDDTVLADFKKLVREVIVGGGNLEEDATDEEKAKIEECYNYILNWIAYIVQNPGWRTMVSIILKGDQGAGKNIFTDILSWLFTGYSEPNVTQLDDLVGPFNKVIENCMFMVLNEMKTAKSQYVQDLDALKSIITDMTARVGDKFERKRTVENVCNLIMISNHARPILIPANDRRYFMLEVCGKYKNTDFLNHLWDISKHPDEFKDFYDNLLTFFMKRDITGFKPFADVPMTAAKQDIVIASRSRVDDWIVEHYDYLVEGINATTLKAFYNASDIKDHMEWKKFNNEIKDKCKNRGRYQKKIDGKVSSPMHILTEENVKRYEPTAEERELMTKHDDE